MQTVSAKVVHLGDQLESVSLEEIFKNLVEKVHEPRARAFDALQMMRHFDEFLAEQPLHSAVFTDPDRVCGTKCHLIFFNFSYSNQLKLLQNCHL